ncbi:MAG: response regulator [Spirochaetes bacterium]|nr:response regulator [Spirochaetota bacterium]
MDILNTYNVAVVDDEEEIRSVLEKKLSKLGLNVTTFGEAEELLNIINKDERSIDLVISDIKLPGIDGIELLRHLDKLQNPMPVLLITGHGSIEHAIQALRYGAYDFIRKPFDLNELASSVNRILRGKREEKLTDNLGQYILYEKRLFEIPSDSTACNVITYILTKDLTAAGFCGRTAMGNISLALKEAIDNAIIHGNLEISSEIIENQGIKEFYDEVNKRKTLKKYSGKKVTVYYELVHDYVEYIIEDDGRGFDYDLLPDPRDPENFFKNSGRGLLIIRTLMDEVDWNAKGNTIRLRKYRAKETQETQERKEKKESSKASANDSAEPYQEKTL